MMNADEIEFQQKVLYPAFEDVVPKNIAVIIKEVIDVASKVGPPDNNSDINSDIVSFGVFLHVANLISVFLKISYEQSIYQLGIDHARENMRHMIEEVTALVDKSLEEAKTLIAEPGVSKNGH